jgi:hypothetical protein
MSMLIGTVTIKNNENRTDNLIKPLEKNIKTTIIPRK